MVPVFAFSTLAQGFFARAATGRNEALSDEKRVYFDRQDNVKRLEKIKKYMQMQNMPSSIPVLGYLINNKLPCVAFMSAVPPVMAADTNLSISNVDSLFTVYLCY